MKHLIVVLISLCSFSFTTEIYAQSKVRAKKYASKAGEKIMDQISPMFGSDVSTYLLDSDFDFSSEKYEMELKVNSYGKTWFGGDRELFSVSGNLTVDKNGQNPIFEITSENNNVYKAKRNAGLGVGVAVLVLAGSLNN